MKKLVGFGLLVSVLLLMFTSCAEMTPGKAAVKYVNYLKEGKYEKYVDAMYQEDGVTAEERTQFIALSKEKGEKAIQEKKGIKEVTLLTEKIAEDGLTASVELELTYGDGTKEKGDYDMIKVDKVWKMKMNK